MPADDCRGAGPGPGLKGCLDRRSHRPAGCRLRPPSPFWGREDCRIPSRPRAISKGFAGLPPSARKWKQDLLGRRYAPAAAGLRPALMSATSAARPKLAQGGDCCSRPARKSVTIWIARARCQSGCWSVQPFPATHDTASRPLTEDPGVYGRPLTCLGIGAFLRGGPAQRQVRPWGNACRSVDGRRLEGAVGCERGSFSLGSRISARPRKGLCRALAAAYGRRSPRRPGRRRRPSVR